MLAAREAVPIIVLPLPGQLRCFCHVYDVLLAVSASVSPNTWDIPRFIVVLSGMVIVFCHKEG